jgi:hypothetical protein
MEQKIYKYKVFIDGTEHIHEYLHIVNHAKMYTKLHFQVQSYYKKVNSFIHARTDGGYSRIIVGETWPY